MQSVLQRNREEEEKERAAKEEAEKLKEAEAGGRAARGEAGSRAGRAHGDRPRATLLPAAGPAYISHLGAGRGRKKEKKGEEEEEEEKEETTLRCAAPAPVVEYTSPAPFSVTPHVQHAAPVGQVAQAPTMTVTGVVMGLDGIPVVLQQHRLVSQLRCSTVRSSWEVLRPRF